MVLCWIVLLFSPGLNMIHCLAVDVRLDKFMNINWNAAHWLAVANVWIEFELHVDIDINAKVKLKPRVLWHPPKIFSWGCVSLWIIRQFFAQQPSNYEITQCLPRNWYGKSLDRTCQARQAPGSCVEPLDFAIRRQFRFSARAGLWMINEIESIKLLGTTRVESINEDSGTQPEKRDRDTPHEHTMRLKVVEWTILSRSKRASLASYDIVNPHSRLWSF